VWENVVDFQDIVCGGDSCDFSGRSISFNPRIIQQSKFLLKNCKYLTNHNETYAGFSGNLCREEREFSKLPSNASQDSHNKLLSSAKTLALIIDCS